MADIHVAITRRVRADRVADFERALAAFAARSLAEPGARGVHFLRPPPDSDGREYGILRSFASEADRDAFYETALFKAWTAEIAPMVEGEPTYRELSGLEAWFRGAPLPRWKMAVLTWVAVWPVSMVVPAAIVPLAAGLPRPLVSGLVAAGIVVVLTWGAMPLLVKAAAPWLHARKKTS